MEEMEGTVPSSNTTSRSIKLYFMKKVPMYNMPMSSIEVLTEVLARMEKSMNKQFDEVIKRLDYTNGSVRKNKEEIQCIKIKGERHDAEVTLMRRLSIVLIIPVGLIVFERLLSFI